MYSMLIVDDEPIVVEGLAYGINWAELKVMDVHKAYTVKQALDCIERFNIDLLITDYRMPEGNGVLVAEALKRHNRYAKSILISAYDDFTYAKEAIGVGVFQYILKPLDYDEVLACAKSALAEIVEDIQKNSYMLSLAEQNKQLFCAARESLLQQLYTTSRYSEFSQVSADELARYGIRLFKNQILFVAVVKAGKRNPEKENDAIREVVLSFLDDADDSLFFINNDDRLIMPISFREESEAATFLESHNQLIEQIQKHLQSMLGSSVSIYISGVSGNMNSLHCNYNRVINQITMDTAMEIDPVVFIDRAPKAKGGSSDSAPVEKLLEAYGEHLKLCDLQQINRLLRIVFDKLKASPEWFFLCKYSFLSLYLECFKFFSIDPVSLTRELSEPFYQPEHLHTSDHLQAWCTGINNAFARIVKKQSNTITNHIVSQCQKIVMDHIMQEITLADVAKQLFVHPNYLSRLFSERTGVTFSEYVTAMKMNKAKELLSGSMLKIYEIAEQIGYRSVPHFSTIFKKVVGITPKEYRDGVSMYDEAELDK